jgi:hypothetical protein|nr:MAG TPA: hypothetical protein [Caudoviricetes sp.]
MKVEDLREDLRPYYDKVDCCHYIVEYRKENSELKEQLKKQQEINKKAIEYIKENDEKYYQDWGQDDGSCDTYLDENEVLKLLQILEDKEV